ncbi:MAG: protein kinase domain-containing protein, partial [Planktothrix sp.]
RIVHRDIKPDNIILKNSDGIPVLIDFGAVKETMGTVMNSSGNGTSSIVIGTPGFMPSEQAAGRPVYSSDLYSLGLTAIFLLTEKWPQELQTNHDTGEIVWRQYAPRISPSLATILDKAIMSHPRDRFHSAREMLDALTTATIPEYGIPPTMRSPSPIHPVPAPVVVAATPLPSSPVIKSSSLGDWQKAAIMGTIIGGFVFVGLWISRPQPATNSSMNMASAPDSTNPELQKSSPETPATLKGVEATPRRSESSRQLDPKQLEELRQNLYKEIDQAWSNYPTFTKPLQYRVVVNYKGTILLYEPVSQEDYQYVQEIPLSSLVVNPEPRKVILEPVMYFFVVFSPFGALEVRPLPNYLH